LPGFDLHDGKYAFSCKLTGLGIVRSRPFADIQVRNADLDKKWNIFGRRRDRPARRVDIDSVIVKHAVAWVAVGAPLGVRENLVSAFLRLTVRPCLADTVIALCQLFGMLRLCVPGYP